MKAGLDRLECPGRVEARAAQGLGPLVLPAPTKRELVAAMVTAPSDPWWGSGCSMPATFRIAGRRSGVGLSGVVSRG
ncbi:hypothetical protein KAURM247S_06457 [Kitasatospora aureofaciens]|nr:hypothetical protein CP971_05515 [Streptomyces viridifaciens]